MSNELEPQIQSDWDSLDSALNKSHDEIFGDRKELGEEVQQTTETPVEPPEEELPVLGKAVKGVAETALQPVLGVADFASDVVGLVPFLKPVDEWWDKNSYRSTHPGHKLIRDASSIILPTMVGGGVVVGSAKAATQAMRIPKYAKTLGSIAAYTGVDTGVAMISSHSKDDDNLAATLNSWLGWQIPWATRASDSPDVRWRKNVYEAAGFAGGVELIGAAFTFARKARMIPKDDAASAAIVAKETQLGLFDDPVEAATKPRQLAREAAQDTEMREVLRADPNGEQGYNAFVNDIGEDAAGKAVTDLEADPLQAKLNQTQIQNNVDTLNGRAAPVADSSFQKRFQKAIDGNSRAAQLDELFTAISPQFDAVVGNTKIKSEQMNKAVDNLTQAIYGKDLNFKEFQFIVDDMKAVTFNSNNFLGVEQMEVATTAFNKAYAKMFDPDQMRASAMFTQQMGDDIADIGTAINMMGEGVDTSRQMKMMFEKLELLGNEVKTNEYITKKALEYKKLVSTGDETLAIDWLNRQGDEFDEYLSSIKAKSSEVNEVFQTIAKENPNYYRPLALAYDATNGEVDTITKLKAWAEENIGLIKKGFIDQNPEVPSWIVQGLQGARYNSVLSGLSAGRAALGNSILSVLKPASVMAGAKMTGDTATLKRASWVYGGFSENIKRAYKVMGDEWRLAMRDPDEAMTRGRADMQLARLENMEIMDQMAKAWEADGELGKVAMWKIARGLSWWNKQNFVRYGTNAMYAIDGFTNSLMASGMARARAYDELFDATKGAPLQSKFDELQRNLYDQAFDANGVLTDEAAKMASKEIALNMDNAMVSKFEDFMTHVPAAKGLFMFPRTGINAFELAWSFNPASNLGPAMTRARRVLSATTGEAKLAALKEHGIDITKNTDEAFASLKSEYIGRQIMGSTVIMGAGMWALEGNLTGNGPQDAAEKRRMMAMGWQPLSFKNPVTGEWHSYRGFEPFDKLLGLTGDIVYQANRVDQAVTEDWFRKLSYSISMNLTNSTFLSGFQPLVSMLSGDPGAWNRFLATQADMTLIPYKGVRSILNNAITPQLKDVENDFFAYLANANKFLFNSNEHLKDLLDVYDGEPIRYFDPTTAAMNSVLPMFKTNGGMEPWRQWLLSTGWDGLQTLRTNPITGMPLTTSERHYINNWIGKNAHLKQQIQNMMTWNDGFWSKKMKEYAKNRGWKSQAEYPVKEWLVHRELDLIHDRAFKGAWNSLEASNEKYTHLGREKRFRNQDLRRGRSGSAKESQKRVQVLLDMN